MNESIRISLDSGDLDRTNPACGYQEVAPVLGEDLMKMQHSNNQDISANTFLAAAPAVRAAAAAVLALGLP